jgi:hypothetical protein
MEKDKDFAGKNGFIWWTGIVENRNDPLKMGQCQVRCVGWDADNKMHLPTTDLPWAKPLLPVNGTNVFAPKEGDMVIGFFIDGESAQERVMMGILPNIPLKASNPQQAFADPRTAEELATAPKTPKEKTYKTDGTGIVITESPQANSYPKILDEPSTSRIARNDAASITKTFVQERIDNVVTGIETVNDTWDEPKTPYNTVYPYNNVVETESGHLLEFDDTPEAERIHLAHRNGSFQEWFPDGDKVEKVTKDNYQIIMGDDRVYIMGKCLITVQGDAEIYVQENAYLLVDKDVEATIHGNLTGQVDGNADITIDGNVTVEVGGNYTEHVTGTYTLASDGNMTIDAPLINLNSGTQGAARIGDTADTGDAGTGSHFDTNSAGTNVIETGSATVIIGG